MGQAAGELDVHISVVHHDNPELIGNCLRSVPGACRGLKWALTLTQNKGVGTAELEKTFYWAQVVKNERPLGFAANHNRVMSQVVADQSARYLLVLNDDTELGENSVTELVNHADAHPGVGALGPATLDAGGEAQPSLFAFPTPVRYLASLLHPSLRPATPVADGGWLIGACLLLRAKALEEVGLFDTRFFMFYEDVDLCARMADRRWRSEVCHAASIVHLGHQTVTGEELSLNMHRQKLRSGYLYFRRRRGAAVASVLVKLGRILVLLRAGGSLIKWVALRSPANLANARRFALLAAYDPAKPLNHEDRG